LRIEPCDGEARRILRRATRRNTGAGKVPIDLREDRFWVRVPGAPRNENIFGDPPKVSYLKVSMHDRSQLGRSILRPRSSMVVLTRSGHGAASAAGRSRAPRRARQPQLDYTSRFGILREETNRAGINANRRLHSRRASPFIPAGLALYSRRAGPLFPQGRRSSPGRHLAPSRPAPTGSVPPGMRARDDGALTESAVPNQIKNNTALGSDGQGPQGFFFRFSGFV
jgi:hypothetical protein